MKKKKLIYVERDPQLDKLVKRYKEDVFNIEGVKLGDGPALKKIAVGYLRNAYPELTKSASS